MKLSQEHLEAVGRRRRIIFQDDVLATRAFRKGDISPERWNRIVDFYMSRLDAVPNQIDSVWHEWGEGNTAVWPSEVIPQTANRFPDWWDIGIDPVLELLDETRKRGREVFFSYRINGSDNDDLFDPPHDFKDPVPHKAEHPDWLIQKWHAYWNFEIEAVRTLKLAILREVAAQYDYDGISIDFARVPLLFPEGRQWECRNLLTDFVRDVRATILDIGVQRGRPYLLAARIPEDLPGCHFDGIDAETWVEEGLVDILVVGARTAQADIPTFRKLTSDTHVRIYPSWDDHHSSDGYRHPSLNVWRGVCANWWRHEPDGMHTFNLMSPSPETHRALEIDIARRHRGGPNDEIDIEAAWELQRHVFNEIGAAETLEGIDKVFYVERRGGGHGEDFVPNPDNWYTPRHAYFQTNMRASLPVRLHDDGWSDALLVLDVADDVNRVSESIDHLSLQVAFSCSDGESPGPEFVDEMEVEVRVNNLCLDAPHRIAQPPTALNAHFTEWLEFPVLPSQLAVGENLVGIRLASKSEALTEPIRVEKVELHVRYKR